MKEPIKTLEGHSHTVSALCLVGPGLLASGSWDNSIKVWDITTGQCLNTLPGPGYVIYNSLCLVGPGQLASGSWGTSIKVWDITTGQCSQTLKVHRGEIKGLCLIGPSQLASGSTDGCIKVCDITTGRCLETLEHYYDVFALCPVGPGQFAAGGRGRSIEVLDIATGKCLQTLTGHGDAVTALCLVGPGRLASGSWDNSIKVWDITTGQCLQTLAEHSSRVNALCLVGPGKLASGSGYFNTSAADSSIKVWDIATGQCLKTLTGHSKGVKALCLIGPGLLASGSYDNSIKVWAIAPQALAEPVVFSSAQPLPQASEAPSSSIMSYQVQAEAEAMRIQGLKAYAQKTYALARVYFTQALEERFAWAVLEKQFLLLHRGLSALSLGLPSEALIDLETVKALGEYEPEVVEKALKEARQVIKVREGALAALVALVEAQAKPASNDTPLEAADIPEDLSCSITGQLMYDPVVTEDGECYEREAITHWLHTHNTSPRTNVTLAHKNLVPNRALFRLIQTFLEKHPTVVESEGYYLPKAIQNSAEEAVFQYQAETLKGLIRTHRGLLFQPLGETYLLPLALALGETYLLPLVLALGDAACFRVVLESLGNRLKVVLAKQVREPEAFLLALANQGLVETFQTVVDALDYSVEALVNLANAWRGQSVAGVAGAVIALFTKLSVLDFRYSLWDVLGLLSFTSQETINLLPYLDGLKNREFYNHLTTQCLKEANLDGAKVMLDLLVQEEGLTESLKNRLEEAAFLALAAQAFELLSYFIQRGAPLEGTAAESVLYRTLLEMAPQKALGILAEAKVSLPEATLQAWLKQAIEEGQLELAQALHAHGALLTYQDANHNTFLHLAAAKGYRALALWLMEQGCSEKAENAQGLRPRAVALTHGFPELAALLAERHRALKFQFFIAPLPVKMDSLTEEPAQMKRRFNA